MPFPPCFSKKSWRSSNTTGHTATTDCSRVWPLPFATVPTAASPAHITHPYRHLTMRRWGLTETWVLSPLHSPQHHEARSLSVTGPQMPHL